MVSNRAVCDRLRHYDYRNAVVRLLFRNLRIPFFILAPNFGVPMHMGVIELSNLFDARHEPGKLLELRPLVVYRAERTIDVDNFLHSFHYGLLFALYRHVAPCHATNIARG
jgi:hypothetical protein